MAAPLRHAGQDLLRLHRANEENKEMVKQHARHGAFPANRVSEVKLVIDPTSAEA